MKSMQQLFSSLQGWVKEQPNAIDENHPTPTPEDVILDDILDVHALLYGVHFPRNSFLKGSKFYAFAQTHDKAWFWLTIDQDFEALMSHWYQNTANKQDEHILALLKQQESGQSVHFVYENTLTSQQIRVLRQNSKSSMDGNPELWEQSKDFTAVVQIKSCRTMVPNLSREAEFGWTWALVHGYRFGLELSGNWE